MVYVVIIRDPSLPPEDLRKQPCSRCGLIDATVEIRIDCEICGPTYLCNDCHEQHEPDRNKL